MGYRSEVVLAVSSKALPVLMHVLSKTPEARDFCFQHSDTLCQDYDSEEGAILFHWSGIKWYDSHPPITAVQSFLLRMGELESEDYDEWACEYRFVRLGEDYDDVEVIGSGFGDVCVSREINF